MNERDKKPERSLNPETLQQMSQLSELKEKTSLKFRVTAKAVGPYTDEVRIDYPDGRVGLEYIEDARES